jgi:hypothetical protein
VVSAQTGHREKPESDIGSDAGYWPHSARRREYRGRTPRFRAAEPAGRSFLRSRTPPPDTARQSLREANFAGTRLYLVLCLVGAGDLARAASELRELKRLEPDMVATRLGGRWLAGDAEVRQREVDFLHAGRAPDRVPAPLAKRIMESGESSEFAGRAVAGLAADPRIMEKSGQLHLVAELAQEYGFTDVDGRMPAKPARA